jgi:hypothetical protein
MSTKHLHGALTRLLEYSMAADQDGHWNLALAARDELEAIEKAATRSSNPARTSASSVKGSIIAARTARSRGMPWRISVAE